MSAVQSEKRNRDSQQKRERRETNGRETDEERAGPKIEGDFAAACEATIDGYGPAAEAQQHNVDKLTHMLSVQW